MPNHQLLIDESILVLEPDGPLSDGDFKAVAAEVDPFIEKHGKPGGVMLEAASFPGWEDFTSMLAHMRFVRDHHRKIKRIAFVTDDSVVAHIPDVAKHFVAAEVKQFAYINKLDTFHWLCGMTEDSERPTGVSC